VQVRDQLYSQDSFIPEKRALTTPFNLGLTALNFFWLLTFKLTIVLIKFLYVVVMNVVYSTT